MQTIQVDAVLRRVLRRIAVVCLLLTLRVAVLVAFADSACAQPSVAAARLTNRINYDLTPVLKMKPRQLQVSMQFTVADPSQSIALQMPVWSPGDYQVQNHAKYVANLRAWGGDPHDGHSLMVAHPDPNTWTIQPSGAKEITLTYTLPETPAGNFSENVQLREKQVFLNGPAVYLYIVGCRDALSTVTVHPPNGWSVETPLPPIPTSEPGAVSFATVGYDLLVDSPILMADPTGITTRDFTVKDVPFRLIFFGRIGDVPNFDVYVPVVRDIVRAEIRMMEGMPFTRYKFFCDMRARGGSGLEHNNSAVLALPAAAQPLRSVTFFAHEFFHLWNVKRIRPESLGPFDYIKPPRTRNLWFAEGVTEYFAQLTARRAGLMTEQGFLNYWRDTILAMRDNPAYLKVTADDASLRVWEEGDSRGFGGLSYYEKGALIGLCFDLKLRFVTENKRSLEDVMRYLMQHHNPPQPGYSEDGLRDAINVIAGQDLSAFYDLLARSTGEMPLAECLAYAGLDNRLNTRANASPLQLAIRKSWAAALPPE